MKKNIFNFLLVIQFVCMAFVSSAQLLDRECIKNNATAQNLISEKISQFSQVTSQISTDVQNLIQQESVSKNGVVLSFENLESLVKVANTLEEYDQQYDDEYAALCNALVQSLWCQSICVGKMSQDEYREEIFEYLEEEKFTLIEEYASYVFAQDLNFESARLKINAEEESWLQTVGENFDDTNPAFNQTMDNDLYWSVLNENWDVELRNPEPQLNNVTGYGKNNKSNWNLFVENDDAIVKGGSIANTTGLFDLKDILLFIFENWDTIEDILAWLNENVFYDCHPSVSASIKRQWRAVPTSMTPNRARRIYYSVVQKGIVGDLKATKTKIKGKVKLYKKKI